MSQSACDNKCSNDCACQPEYCKSKLQLKAKTKAKSKSESKSTLKSESKNKSNDKSPPIRDNKYYAQKMKESRHRRKKLDKLFYKQFVYTVDVGNKKYVFLSKSDMNIKRMHKDELKLNDHYILTY